MSDPIHTENGKPTESVWDYPRPPKLERVQWRIRVIHRDHAVVDAPEAHRVLETSQPPAYYVDPIYVDTGVLRPSSSTSRCEWKGTATYVDLDIDGALVSNAAWRYDEPNHRFAAITGHYAFYAQAVDRCLVDDEVVAANEGRFYGGWITTNVTGPFKGGPGSLHW